MRVVTVRDLDSASLPYINIDAIVNDAKILVDSLMGSGEKKDQ